MNFEVKENVYTYNFSIEAIVYRSQDASYRIQKKEELGTKAQDVASANLYFIQLSHGLLSIIWVFLILN